MPGRPAEERQVVDQRLADEALGDVVGDRGLALALAHLRPVRVEDERQVGEERDRVAERAEHQDLLRRVREVVLAADDVADLHRGVVDHDREVVERRAVAADDDEVAAEVRDVDLDPAADDVVEGDDAGPDPEADRARSDPRPRARLVPPRSARRSGRRSAAAAWPPPAPCGRRRAPRACSSRGRPCRPPGDDRRPRRRTAAGASGDTARTARGRPRRRPRGPRPSAGRASAARRGCPSRRRSSRAPGRCPRVAGRRSRRCGARTGS